MKLGIVDCKFVKWKNHKITILSGQVSDKRTSLLTMRSLFLKSNYCFSEEDEILLTSPCSNNLQNLRGSYNNLQCDYGGRTLLWGLSKEPTIINIDCLAEQYLKKYMLKNNLKLEVIKDKTIENKILKTCIDKVIKDYKRIKVFRDMKIQKILDEIKWIKNYSYKDLKSYQQSPKHNGFRKNSKAREGIFKVKSLYDKKLSELGYISYEDMLIYAQKEADLDKKFTHILINEGEKLSYLQWNFLKSLQKNTIYSSFTLCFDTNNEESTYCPFVKNGRVYTKLFGEKTKRFNIKIKNSTIKTKKEKYKGKSKSCTESLEKFQYFDLRHKVDFTMFKEYSNSNEILVDSSGETLEYKSKEITTVPVFTNIAAGEPIYIDPSLEDNFSLPKQWIKGLKDCFILKVRGNSMINANIHDGDFVVIHKQMDVIHNDIIAANISGNATLKRLKIDKEGVFLMPENENYQPIPVTEEGIFILGKAVGIIRKMESMSV